MLLTASAVLPRFESGWARIISGSDEGAYGWVAMNYRMGTLLASGAAALSQEEASGRAGREVGGTVAGEVGSSGTMGGGQGGSGGGGQGGRREGRAEDDTITVGALDLGGSSLEVSPTVQAVPSCPGWGLSQPC